MSDLHDLIVIGGGAAGFYGAIRAAEMKPGLGILIIEKTNKLLSKVKISGGGRCNVTHHEFSPITFADHYPRGEKQLRVLFKSFHAEDTVKWFHEKQVRLKAEEDGRMFPVTDDSQTIVNCFLQEAMNHKIRIETGKAVVKITQANYMFEIHCSTGEKFWCKKVLVAPGGNANPGAYQFIANTGHTIIKPIPSLFTFNDSEKNFRDLMGLSVTNAEARITTTKFTMRGPVLITHWGLSGPAIIRLSAWAAEYLHAQNYAFTVSINWTSHTEEEVRKIFQEYRTAHGKQKVFSNPMFAVPQRLWQRLCVLAEVPEEKIWAEVAQKYLNKLVENLIRCSFAIKGKTTFKEEFVTCGGVDLKEIDIQTMESKKIKNLFFAGEVLNIDGETGGFNFQAAWTTANAAAKSIAQK